MDYYLRRIDPKSACLTFLGIGSIFGCILAALAVAASVFGGKTPEASDLGLLIFNTTISWTIAGIFLALAYNFISSRLGGIALRFEEAENQPESDTPVA